MAASHVYRASGPGSSARNRKVVVGVVLSLIASALVLVGPQADQARAVGTAQPFGVMIPSWDDAMDTVDAFGATSVRPGTVNLRSTTTCSSCWPYRDANIDIVLTVANAENSRRGPAVGRPPSNMGTYRSRLGTVLDNVGPAVLAVENEEDGGFYYEGSAWSYGEQLRNACEVAHARGIQCMNGGLTAHAVINMLYIHYYDSGQFDQADSFARRLTKGDYEYNYLEPGNVNWIRNLAEEAHNLLDRYAPAGADWVNFHWYEPDAQAFEEVVTYLKAETNLPIASNEIGQRNEDPAITTARMQVITRQQMPLVVWNSQDIVNADRVRALQNLDQVRLMRPHGLAFQKYIAELPTQPSGHRNISVQIDRMSRDVTFFGNLVGSSSCLAGQTVLIERMSWDETSVVRSVETVTNASGAYQHAIRLSDSMKVRVSTPAAAGCSAAESHAFPLYIDGGGGGGGVPGPLG